MTGNDATAAAAPPGGTQVLAGLVEQDFLRGIPRACAVGCRPGGSSSAAARGRSWRAQLALRTSLSLVSHAGLPLHESADGWFELIGPVQQMLVARAPVDDWRADRGGSSLRRGRPPRPCRRPADRSWESE